MVTFALAVRRVSSGPEIPSAIQKRNILIDEKFPRQINHPTEPWRAHPLRSLVSHSSVWLLSPLPVRTSCLIRIVRAQFASLFLARLFVPHHPKETSTTLPSITGGMSRRISVLSATALLMTPRRSRPDLTSSSKASTLSVACSIFLPEPTGSRRMPPCTAFRRIHLYTQEPDQQLLRRLLCALMPSCATISYLEIDPWCRCAHNDHPVGRTCRRYALPVFGPYDNVTQVSCSAPRVSSLVALRVSAGTDSRAAVALRKSSVWSTTEV